MPDPQLDLSAWQAFVVQRPKFFSRHVRALLLLSSLCDVPTHGGARADRECREVESVCPDCHASFR
eukprot:127949-Alexandrium_andersonii.AAC.1